MMLYQGASVADTGNRGGNQLSVPEKKGRCIDLKPFTKFCLYLAGALGMLGFVGIAVGMAMGARPEQFLNLAHYERAVWNNRAGHGHGEYQEELQIPEGDMEIAEGSFGGADTRNLWIDLTFAEVTISCGEGDEIYLKTGNGKEYLDIETDEDTLSIRDTRNYQQYSRDKALVLDIVLPDRSFDEIMLDLGGSEVTAEALRANDIEIDIGGGTLTAEVIQGFDVSVSLGAGTVYADSLKTSGTAELSAGTGEISVSSFAGADLDLECGIGSLELTVQGQETDYDYNLECGMGEIQIGEKSYSGIARGASIDNGSGRLITAECGIGDIVLNFAEEL